ncbi:hypothetical protein [Legionella sp. 16cNR16C]|uniref:hypothetical protein n=1 Tax=Legionella sp. 16cNR16C TaxID=2905656 RepID=UPI001E2B9E39|nr:hypothetical protein [Legionella sp. 16cNR16C]MCE3044211.1 hypothetical protein [Legionella sp. 16cNR16C]
MREHYTAIPERHSEPVSLLDALRTKLPHSMREHLNSQTLTQVYFLLTMLSDEACVRQLHQQLQEHYKPVTTHTPIEEALTLVGRLQESPCNHRTPFKYRLPHFLSEYPVHSRAINHKINRFNRLIESYHQSGFDQRLNTQALNEAYQNVLRAIKKHHMGCNINNLWQLLKAMSAWSAIPIDNLLSTYPSLLAPAINQNKPEVESGTPLPRDPVIPINPAIAPNKSTPDISPFTATSDYQISKAGRIADASVYLSTHGFALKPGGHADALAKKLPDFLPWQQWQAMIRRQLSQLIDLPLNEEFFDWMQTVLQRLGIQFIQLKKDSYDSYVSPFLDGKTILNSLNEEMLVGILQEQLLQANIRIDSAHLPVISRYLIRFLQRFQFNRGQALGIGANWGGVVSDSNDAGMDTFRLNDPEWASHFKNLSVHRQGPAEARMNAAIGIKYELGALFSSFNYMTTLQPSEYSETVYNALVDNLVAHLFPEPPYFENNAYVKYRRHYVSSYSDAGLQQIDSFYQPDPQGTYFKTAKGDFKQTPMFRQAGSLLVEAFPRDTGSGDSLQSFFVANPLWPLQLQYAQCNSTGTRGHLVYNPVGPDEFIPDAFYGQVIRESDEIFIPFIGVVPKNFDKHFQQEELCASFVVRMLQSSRLMIYCPAFHAYYNAIATRFLPPASNNTPLLTHCYNDEIQRKWQSFDEALHHPQRTADNCHKAFLSLFKELIYSLYSCTKDDVDLHYYFMELTTSADAFEPQSRSTCERLIRELTTLKPFQNTRASKYCEAVLGSLKELTQFYYPSPTDETAKSIAEQARLHVKPLLALQEIKDYFADLTQHNSAANISRKVSPGLMHNALAYQAPSPAIADDFYRRRHQDNFHSGFRDLDGNQIATPSGREIGLDLSIKTVGALLPLIHRDKTVFSVLTQPFAQAYIAGYQAYSTEEQYKIIHAILSGAGGFIYGIGLGVVDSLSSIPKAIYNSLLAPVTRQPKSNHPLAISSAPGNEPGLRVQAMMAIRDHLLRLIATANGHELSQDELINLLLIYVKKIHPDLLSGRVFREESYKKILSDAFPLTAGEWKQLFDPAINAANPSLRQIVNQYALQIDNVLIYALYECLTAPQTAQITEQVTRSVIKNHKLKDPQDKALLALVFYYNSYPEARRADLAQYRFQGSALARLRTRERVLRKLQIWLNNALDRQWALEASLNYSLEQYTLLLNQSTLAGIVAELPDSMKEILKEVFSRSENEGRILKRYRLNEIEKAFLLRCSNCYKSIISPDKRAAVLEQTRIDNKNDSSLSTKTREHLKLTEFVQREWQHKLLGSEQLQSVIDEIKRQIGSANHSMVDDLFVLYKEALRNPGCSSAFDAFYEMSMKMQSQYRLGSPLREWVNVTMNAFMNLLLDDMTWINDRESGNRLNESQAIVQWLSHLSSASNEIRSILRQQVEQAGSLDLAAWRCQHILHALEGLKPQVEPVRHTGMQKLLRVVVQNRNVITSTAEQKDREVAVKALCKYSVTMQQALHRVSEKIPGADIVRPLEVTLKGPR